MMEWIIKCFTTPHAEMTALMGLTVAIVLVVPLLIGYIVIIRKLDS